MRLAIGSDHGGLELKRVIVDFLKTTHPEISIMDVGTYTTDSVDYPDFGRQVATHILHKEADAGILICGTGIGISMMANRFKGIRAALVHDRFTAEMSKAHNNANILCLGGRTTSVEDAKTFVKIWLDTPFEGGRHQGRLDKLDL
jgi:ribose 5-phosphate isomerase B